MRKTVSKILLFVAFLFFLNSNISFSENIGIPCNVKECNPKLGTTLTELYPGDGDKKKPAIMWFAGGPSTSLYLSYQPIILLQGKFDIIMVASPLPIISNKSTQGFPKNAYNKDIVYRMKQVTEFYKKKLGKPIWLGGTSAGGPRMMGVIIGNEKDRPSDRYAGLIFATPYLASIKRDGAGNPTGQFTYNIRVSSIKYKMNLPILVVNHERDHKAAQHPSKMKWFTKQLAKRNSNITELKLLTEGDPKITDYDGGHHFFEWNKPEFARVVSKFILDNTK
jgi:hypothetical protein